MRGFYEAFWADAPQDPEPYEWERRRALLLGEVQPGDRALDLGCGAGRFLAPAGATRSAWRSPRRRRTRAGERARRRRAPAASRTARCPSATASSTWSGARRRSSTSRTSAQTLGEIRRVLRPGGRALITVPYHARVQAARIALTRFEAHFDPLGQHVRFFTRRSVSSRADALAFTGFEADGSARERARSLVAPAIRCAALDGARECRRGRRAPRRRRRNVLRRCARVTVVRRLERRSARPCSRRSPCAPPRAAAMSPDWPARARSRRRGLEAPPRGSRGPARSRRARTTDRR